MQIKNFTVPIDSIIPGQHYLSHEKYQRIKASLNNTRSYGTIYVMEYKKELFSIDGNHRLFYLYNNGVKYVNVTNEETDNQSTLYQTLADESLALGLNHIKDLEPRMISDALFQIKWIDKCQIALLDAHTINQYKDNPCKYSSLPLYKAIRQNPNSDMSLIHDSNYQGETGKMHQQFLRLKHDLTTIHTYDQKGFKMVKVDKDKDMETVIDIINASYDTIQITQEAVKLMTLDRVYNPTLWQYIVDESTQKPIALGIAHCDTIVNEVILDWIQVLPAYRKRGLGKMLLSHMLKDAKSLADFATVSCDYHNPSSPETLYRSIGFKGNDLWHIIKA